MRFYSAILGSALKTRFQISLEQQSSANRHKTVTSVASDMENKAVNNEPELDIPSSEVESEGVSAHEAALSVLQWAKEHHLFSRPPMEESAEAVEDEVDLVPQKMFSAREVQDVFRRRAINLMGFNERERKVVIFTKGRLTATERKILPFHVTSGVTIDYIHGGVAQVRGNHRRPKLTTRISNITGTTAAGVPFIPRTAWVPVH